MTLEGPLAEGLPPTPAILEAGVPKASHTGLPRSSSRYAAHTRAGVLFHLRGLSLSGSSWLGHRGICGWPMGRSLEALADLTPWGPALLLLQVRPVVDFSGHLLGGGQAGSGFTAHLEGQIHAVLCWMPGPVKSRWLTCYLWRPPDSGLILSFWVGHDASAIPSTNRPGELINQS